MFVKQKQFSTTFKGATVTAVIAPLELEDLLDIQGSEGSDSIKRCAHVLPKYVSELTGISATIEEVYKYAYFQSLMSALGVELLASGDVENPITPVVASDG